MKKTFLSIFLLAILVGSCGDKSSKNSNTHTHEDGTEHVNHDTTMEKAPEQEVFEVEIDSSAVEKNSLKSKQETEHSHDGGHKHKH